MMKKFCAWLLALLMLVTIIPIEQIPGLQVILFDVVKANDEPGQTVVESGKCGETASWVLTKDKNGVYTITYSGTGAIWAPAILGDYYNKSIVIKNGITEISDEGFYGCSLQGDLIIPNSVTKIGKNAFKHCWIDGTLVLSNKIQSIGDGAFSNCDGLSGIIEIPETLTSYSVYSFGFDDKSIDLPCKISDELNLNPFTNQLELPFDVNWKSDNKAVATVNQSGHVICVGPGNCIISAECEGITKKYNLEVIDEDNRSGHCDENTMWKITKKKDGTHQIVFSGTGAIWAPDILSDYDHISVVIENGITEISDEGFYGSSLQGDLIIPNSVTKIGKDAFKYSRFNGELVLSNQLQSVGDGAFSYCDALSGTIDIPETLTSYSASSFGFNDESYNDICFVNDKFDLSPFTNQLVIPSVKWQSNNEEVATVDQNGHVICLSPGNCVISAEFKDAT